jgi:riboflavin kinase/FMN adenylyltransferase
VVAGRGLGRELGWPTLNIAVDGRKFLPLEGVYAARAWRVGQENGAMAAVMNLGPQPTLGLLSVFSVEVHLLDRHIDLYGSDVTVEPVKFLRGQRRFDSLQELGDQIGRDAAMARDALAGAKPCAQA